MSIKLSIDDYPLQCGASKSIRANSGKLTLFGGMSKSAGGASGSKSKGGQDAARAKLVGGGASTLAKVQASIKGAKTAGERKAAINAATRLAQKGKSTGNQKGGSPAGVKGTQLSTTQIAGALNPKGANSKRKGGRPKGSGKKANGGVSASASQNRKPQRSSTADRFGGRSANIDKNQAILKNPKSTTEERQVAKRRIASNAREALTRPRKKSEAA
jgi:hypothetical protein